MSWTGEFALEASTCDNAAMSNLIVSDPDILSGEPVFAGTRVPVKTLTDYLEGGDSIDEFLEDFPTVTRAQAVGFLREAREALVSPA